jgi:hypothetical protein
LQNQRRQRPLAALILEWLGNGHEAMSALASKKTSASCSHRRLAPNGRWFMDYFLFCKT